MSPADWNILAVYLGILAVNLPSAGPWLNGLLILFFAGLTVAPVWFVYPNRAPAPWRLPVIGGGLLWLAMVLAMLPYYPEDVPGWLAWISLLYPVFYIVISIHLWRRRPSDAV
jgi:phosphatidylcholine synthase